MAAFVDKITFRGSQGDLLAARLDRPAGEPRAFALFAHCFTCGKDIRAASRISAGLVADGFAVLRFDFTGLGSSEGEFANTDFTSNLDDLVAAADMLRDRYEAPTLLIGHSLGGAAVLAAAGRIPEVAALATIGAPSDPAHVSGLFTADNLAEIERHGATDVELAGRRFRVNRSFLDDIGAHQLDEAVSTLRAALLILHSPIDNVVGIDHARRLYDQARHPKSFVSLDGADHLLTERRDGAYVAGILGAWASRYLPDPGPSSGEASAGHGQVVVEESHEGDYAQTVRAGTHTWTADEPPEVGDDAGPGPYDMLLGGLGACTSMTVRMYARRKKLPLDHVRVTLHHERMPFEPASGDGPAPKRVEVITRHVELAGDLDDEQRATLLEIANKCPVHRTLQSDLRVTTTVAELPPA